MATELIRFGERRAALALGDYLRTLGIATRLDENEDGIALMLLDPAKEELARAEVETFLVEPDNPRYWQASWQTGQVQSQDVYGEPGESLWAMWSRRAGPVTMGLTAICVLVFLFMSTSRDNALMVIQALTFPDQLVVAAVLAEPWRLLTPALLHFSVLHIVFNLLWWWDLGGLIERTQSSGQLLGVALCTAFFSNLLQFHYYGSQFGGMSGVVYGLLGYVWLYPVFNPSVGFQLRKEILIFMVGWLLIGYSGILDGLLGPMANAAHGAGLLGGMLLGVVFGLAHRKELEED